MEVDLKNMNTKTCKQIEQIVKQFHKIYKLTFKNDDTDLEQDIVDTIFSSIKTAPNLRLISLPAWCSKEKEF